MEITKYKKYSKDELISRLRKVTLLSNSKTKNHIYVYKDAKIEIGLLSVPSIMPSQFYYLEDPLVKVGNIQKALKKANFDLFKLDGFIEYRTNESDTTYDLMPIVIEYQSEKDGSINPIIVDGIHRVILARNQNLKKIQVVKISNVHKDYPYPGYVNPKGWRQVKPMLVAPEPKYKRPWRFPIDVAYNYYRDFNSAFENVGKPRTY
ncbi:MAG: hypothetical protein HYT07_00160 [Candidatus Levybacteria bacterium]|nr:hypothetical protein [Candidatus Levybacteria bacterium]